MTDIHLGTGVGIDKITPDDYVRVEEIGNILNAAKLDKPNIHIYIDDVFNIMKHMDNYITTDENKGKTDLGRIIQDLKRLQGYSKYDRPYISDNELDFIFEDIKYYMKIDPEDMERLNFKVKKKTNTKSKKKNSLFSFLKNPFKNKNKVLESPPPPPSILPPPPPPPSMGIPGGKRRRSRKNKTRGRKRKTRSRSHK